MTPETNTKPLAATSAPQRIAERPRIYVACLAAYNCGILHGCWIEVTTPEEVWTEVRAMLAASPEPDAEEWAIHDYEGLEDCTISEWASFDTVCALADFIAEHGVLGAKIYTHFGEDLGAAIAAFEEYAGEFKSVADFAEDLIRETGAEIPAALEFYIDWEALARDMSLNGEIITIEMAFDEVHVFWSG